MTHLIERPRRLRYNPLLREAVAEHRVERRHLMQPMFVADVNADREIQGMPGVLQRGIDSLSKEIEQLVELGVKSFILFGVPDGEGRAEKDPTGKTAVRDDGIVPRALTTLKKRLGDSAFLATDVCLCAYTDHGHCGFIVDGPHARIDNDPSLEQLAKMALVHAQAGADMVAPSDMMDGRVGRIREVLDGRDFAHIPLMSYAVKYASSLYGPFRHAQSSSPKFGDRKSYQMDYRNRKDAVREARLDVAEGADVIMVKPGLAYLDILAELRDNLDVPLAAYQVSGEYSMIRFAAMQNAIDEGAVVRELWTSFVRAGASLILTYHAGAAARAGWVP